MHIFNLWLTCASWESIRLNTRLERVLIILIRIASRLKRQTYHSNQHIIQLKVVHKSAYYALSHESIKSTRCAMPTLGGPRSSSLQPVVPFLHGQYHPHMTVWVSRRWGLLQAVPNYAGSFKGKRDVRNGRASGPVPVAPPNSMTLRAF